MCVGNASHVHPASKQSICQLQAVSTASLSWYWAERKEADNWDACTRRVPEECPQEVADLIAACRSNSPVPRPTAQEVLEVLQGSGKSGVALNVSATHSNI